MINLQQLRVLIAISVSHITGNICYQGIGPLAPFYQPALDINRTQIGLLASSLSFGRGLTSLLAGWFTDLVGVRLSILFGQLLLGVAIMAVGGFNNYTIILILIFIAGIGDSPRNPASVKATMYHFHPKGRGTIMGIIKTGVTVGGTIAALGLPAIAVIYSWRVSFLFAGLTSVISGILAFALYKEPSSGDSVPAEEEYESEHGSHWDLLKDKKMLIICFSGALFSAVQLSMTSYLVLYLKEHAGFPILLAASGLAIVQLGGAVSRIGMGVLSDIVFGGRRKIVLIIIGFIFVLMSIINSFITRNSSTFIIFVVCFFMGLSANGWAGIMAIFRAEVAGRKRAGTATGMGLTVMCLGDILGPPSFGLVVDKLGSYPIAWLLLGIYMSAAISLIATVSEKR